MQAASLAGGNRAAVDFEHFELPQAIIGSGLIGSVGESVDGLGVLADVERGDGGLSGGRGTTRNGQQVALPAALRPMWEKGGCQGILAGKYYADVS